MAINITADPLVINPSINANMIIGLVINADPLVTTPELSADFSIWYVTNNRNPDLDFTFDCRGYDSNGDPYKGILSITPAITGSWFNITHYPDSLIISPVISGSFVEGVLISSSPLVITPVISADIIFNPVKNNWVKWSNIGNLDFTIGRDNIAGERPLDWAGSVYQIKKLDKVVIVYGANGVSVLNPSGNTFGLSTIYHLGLKSKLAITGTDQVHYFIDTAGQLWSLSDKLTKLDYSEYLSAMSSPVMSYDVENDLIYISDGTKGYVYSPSDKSFGTGPVNITGFGNQNGSSYIGAPAAIAIPVFEMSTDIYDLGSRKHKTIHSIEIGTDTSKILYASIDYRSNHKSSFSNTGWATVTHEGVSYLRCYGIEFKFNVKVSAYDSFAIDYLKINGVIHRYSPIDA